MSLEIRIPEEINKYEPKMWKGFSKRQMIFGGIIAAWGIGLFSTQYGHMDRTLLMGVFFIGAAVPAVLGFAPPQHGMSAEAMLKKMLHNVVDVQKRKYVDLPVFWFARQEIIQDNLNLQRAEKRRKKRKREPLNWYEGGDFSVVCNSE
jgi:hypothetical protein